MLGVFFARRQQSKVIEKGKPAAQRRTHTNTHTRKI